MELKINTEAIIEAYNNGESFNSIAKRFSTYPTTIRRILIKNEIELRHDYAKKDILNVKNGEKLIEWAKAQGRPVTKAELAEIVGTKRLSPSYFVKYPELGQYVVIREQNELQKYSEVLYDWLQKHDIQYKPNDRTMLGVSVTALLLGKHSNIALQIAIKPKFVSVKNFSETMIEKKNRAHEQDMNLIFLYEKDFNKLEVLEELL